MEKSAKELFKELGYKQFNNKWDLEYEKIYGFKPVIRYKTRDGVIELHFDCIDEDYSIISHILGHHPPVSVGMRLHNAICKQIEELGWSVDK